MFCQRLLQKERSSKYNWEGEAISYSNESQLDLLSPSEEECAMVAQDSQSSEYLDDTIITF